ncbi:MAG: NlpC/P60 family protein, partial [Peptostreptococcaceae bacterium]
KHDNLISSNRCRIAGCGIMQIEKPGITITSASAYNHQTGQTDTFSVSHASVSNLEENIKIGTMLYANRVALQGYHMILGLQSYNFGTGGTNAVLKVYEEATGKSPDAVRADHSDLGWLSYTAEVHQNPKRYFTWNENQSVMCSQEACTNKGLGHFGDISYVSNVLRYYVNPTGTTWAKSKDGALYEMNLGEAGMNIGTSSGVPSTGGSASHKGWLGRLWDKLMDAWKTLFPLIPDELPIERLPFSAYPRDHQIDTIIKMMFAMDEQKYLTEYNDFDEEAFKEKYKELFSNAFGGTNGSNNDIANALFPNGFEKPINIKPATISKDYDGTNIEYVALNGTEVFAVSSGEVVEVSSSSIKIKHDGDVYTIYTYVSNSLSVGDKVDKGEQIGTTIDGKFGIGLLKGDSNINGSWLVEDSFDFTDYNMTEEDAKIIQAVISLGKTKIGGVYTQDLNRRNGPDTFDCSGFTRYIYEQITGVNIGANTTGQYNILKNYQVQGGLSNAQPGDLILASGRHVMVYLGNMQVLHASNSKPWPAGGIKENGINRLEHDEIIVRPIAYINSVKGN